MTSLTKAARRWAMLWSKKSFSTGMVLAAWAYPPRITSNIR